MNKSYIAVFDSGVGGLNILESLVKEFPQENFIYVADEEFFPYGVKTKEQLENRISKIAITLSNMNVKAIIIACNTASANSHHLKNILNTKIIEIITATADYAYEISESKKIGVWATNATIISNKYQEALVNAKNCYPVKASDLVELIESNSLNETKLITLLPESERLFSPSAKIEIAPVSIPKVIFAPAKIILAIIPTRLAILPIFSLLLLSFCKIFLQNFNIFYISTFI